VDFSSSVLVFTALVNIHHFILDGAVWKLRDSRVASLLIQTAKQPASAMSAAAGAGFKFPFRVPHVVKAAAVTLLLVLAGLDQFRHYLGVSESNASRLALAATLNPNDAGLYVRLGRAYAADGQRDNMESALRASVRVNPFNVEAQNLLARFLIEERRYDDVYQHYLQMFAKIRPDAPMLVNFGLICREISKAEEAVDSFQRALSLDSGYPAAHLHLAETLAAYGRAEEAIPHYERYIQTVSSASDEIIIDPRHTLDATIKLAGVYALTGRTEKAVALYEECARIAAQGGDEEVRDFALMRIEEIRADRPSHPAHTKDRH
jgi:tetratricopeptide (TPR) repeat protein